MSSKHPFIYYRLPVIGLCILIFWQSCFPSPVSTPLFPHDDKLIHFLMFALLAFLTARDLKHEKPVWSIRKIILTAVVFSIVYGLSDELHQAFVPTRSASVLDFLANSIGSLAGGFAASRFSDHLLTKTQ